MMRISCSLFKRKVLITALALAMPVVVSAETSNSDLQLKIEDLQNQVNVLSADVKKAAEWKNPNTLVHMAGYAAAGFSKTSGENSSFNIGSFSPIFHFQYRDIVMLESELEFETADDGSTATKLEYLTIDWFVNDNMALVVGQFLSPIGQFRQNTHPSWINKLPSAPPGFGHDGAAPVSDMGVQVRGGFHIAGMKANYAAYVGNGPEIKAGVEDDGAGSATGIEYDGVAAEAFGADRDGKKVVGGRFGLLPIPSFEIGISILTGKAMVTQYEGLDASLFSVSAPPDLATTAFSNSNFDVLGADASWRYNNMDMRYEYVQSKVGATTIGTFNLGSAKWSTWYTQLSYKLPTTKYEAVARFTDFNSPGVTQDVQQGALGMNYLFTNNFIGKAAYEFNNNPNSSVTVGNRMMLQLAYGF